MVIKKNEQKQKQKTNKHKQQDNEQNQKQTKKQKIIRFLTPFLADNMYKVLVPLDSAMPSHCSKPIY